MSTYFSPHIYALALLFSLLLLSSPTHATDTPSLGINYLEITKNPVLTRFMETIEPRLVRYYQSSKFEALRTPEMVHFQTQRFANILTRDSSNKSHLRVIRKVATPEELTLFLQLDKSKFPNLWNFGELVRLEIETAKSQQLYEALHGQPYTQTPKDWLGKFWLLHILA